ncbi:MAG TPA: SDR family oxidoreductase [Kiloniellales bacterium]|nr:SDR family oxidoreductase [Kiloniellales bacterium]
MSKPPMLSIDLSGLRVMITAGAAGIGRAMAEGFLANGARVELCDVDEAALEETAKALPQAGTHHCDVADAQAVEGFFQSAVGKLGGLDVLVNNAGVAGPTKRVEEISEEEWRRTLDIDLTGQFLCARKAVPHLRQAGSGSIVNLSSAAGIFAFPLRSPYAASKWGIIGFTKTLAAELGEDRIRVNALCPGVVEGERIRAVIEAKARQRGISDAEMEAILLAETSMKCFISPYDIANMALYLCSPLGATISGQALSIDGHMVAMP